LHYTSKEEINQLIEGLKVALDNLFELEEDILTSLI